MTEKPVPPRFWVQLSSDTIVRMDALRQKLHAISDDFVSISQMLAWLVETALDHLEDSADEGMQR
jgi:hypothetical protein